LQATSSAASQAVIHRVVGTAASGQFNILFNANKILVNSGVAALHTGTITLAQNTWYHVAVVRDGSNNLDVYIDGVKGGSTYSTSWDINSSDALQIGKEASNGGASFSGYLDEFRISKGVARWTSDFTPPARPYSTVNDEFFNDYD